MNAKNLCFVSSSLTCCWLRGEGESRLCVRFIGRSIECRMKLRKSCSLSFKPQFAFYMIFIIPQKCHFAFLLLSVAIKSRREIHCYYHSLHVGAGRVDIVRLSAVNVIFILTREIRGQGQLIRIESATTITTKIMNFQNKIKTPNVYSSH